MLWSARPGAKYRDPECDLTYYGRKRFCAFVRVSGALAENKKNNQPTNPPGPKVSRKTKLSPRSYYCNNQNVVMFPQTVEQAMVICHLARESA